MADEKKSGALAMWVGGAGLPAASKEAVAQALAESANAGSSSGGDKDFLSFSGQGANYAGWKLGRDKKTPDPEALYIVDSYSSIEGWTCWKGGSVAEKHEWPVFERATQAMPQSSLKDHGPYSDGDGWAFMMGISMFDVDQPERQIAFSTTSKSGRNALSDLISEISTNILSDDPDIPIVMLQDEQFVGQGKKNGKPIFAVEGWVTREEVETYLGMGDDGDLEDLLAGKYAGTAGPSEPEAEAAEEVEEVEEAPKRRSRRKAAAG